MCTTAKRGAHMIRVHICLAIFRRCAKPSGACNTPLSAAAAFFFPCCLKFHCFRSGSDFMSNGGNLELDVFGNKLIGEPREFNSGKYG